MATLKYTPDTPEQARKLCLLGATDAQLASFFGVTQRTINKWKRYPEFKIALVTGKAAADAKVAESLYRRALGYEHPAVKIMQYEGQVIMQEYTERFPPDVGACVFWLRNRAPQRWRDDHVLRHVGTDESIKHGVGVKSVKLDFEADRDAIIRAAASATAEVIAAAAARSDNEE